MFWDSCRYSDPSLWTAYLGLTNQGNLKGPDVQTRKIKRIISHPYFNDYTYDYDIAVVELQSPVTFSSVVQPICLPDATHNFPVGKDLWVTGWGATVEGGECWRCLVFACGFREKRGLAGHPLNVLACLEAGIK